MKSPIIVNDFQIDDYLDKGWKVLNVEYNFTLRRREWYISPPDKSSLAPVLNAKK